MTHAQSTMAVDVLSLLSVCLHGDILNFMLPSTALDLEGGKEQN